MELRNFFYKLLIIAGVLIGLYILFQVRSLLLLFFGAILFASTIQPAVAVLKNRGIPPLASILVIYLAFLGLAIGMVAILFPSLFLSIQDLIQSQSRLTSSLEMVLAQLQGFISNAFGVRVPLPSVAELEKYVSDIQQGSQQGLDSYLFDGFRLGSEAVILFVLAFYWLTERGHFEEVGLRMIPLRHRDRFRGIFGDIEMTLGAFVRGQIILCATVGVLAFIALSVLGIRSAVLLAVFAAVAEAIPMIGPIIGAIPAILVALLYSPQQALLVAGAYLVIQQFESQVLIPKVMERQVGLSPLFVLLALTAGNVLGGIPGALVAIPIAAALRILARDLVIAPTVAANAFPVVEGAVLITEKEHVEAKPASAPAPTVLVATPAPAAGATVTVVGKNGEPPQIVIAK